LSRLNAKVLRIDVDNPADGRTYAVPADNPFVGMEGIRPETWAYGLRNPWRIDCDRSTGAIWVGNNGQDLVEQVYEIARGANYGWSAREGSRPFVPEREAGPSPISPPTCEHDHSEARSLTGGIVCRDVRHADLEGEYVYGDHVTGRIWAVPHDDADASVPRLLADTQLMITSFARGHAGDVLVTDFFIGNTGGIYRLVPRPPQAEGAAFPRRLSETGLFASVPRHELVPGVIPYGVNAPQWGDGTQAVRAVVLPETMQVRTAERGWFTVPARMEVTPYQGWNLPDGTVIVQSLAAEARPGDPASRRWIETRLLLRNEGDWAGYTYRWSDNQQDAELVAAEGHDADVRLAAAGAERVQRWRYPSRAECLVCHSQSANFVLGLSTVQLNRDFDYHAVLGGDAATDNQLRTLEHLGLLWQDVDALSRQRIVARVGEEVRAGIPAPAPDQRAWYDAEVAKRVESIVKRCTSSPLRDGRPALPKSTLLFAPPAELPRLANPHDATQDLAIRVRSYLHANCSSCHIAAGGGNSRIMFDFGTPLDRSQAIDEKPMHATFGIADARIVAPGDPDRSVLLYRLSRRGPAQMPPLCSLAVDDAAVALVREWIESLHSSTRESKP
jgi:mono/diheme cytochrome c family protein